MRVGERTAAVNKSQLPNGLTILTEEMPHVRTVAVGIWVKSGSRAEPGQVNGISHFIEHTVFKGTATRTAEQIAREMDSVGGNVDAFTGKEMVAFTAKVMDEHLPRALDVLSDLVLAPLFNENDLRKEQGVILEEIKMEQDNPEYLAQETFTQNFWRDHSIGRPILGTPHTVRSFTSQSVRDFYERWYAPERMVLTAAGRLDHDRLVELVQERFGTLPGGNGRGTVPAVADGAPRAYAGLTRCHKPELEQVQLCLGVPSYPLPDERRYAAGLLSVMLGGGMSSRLFQKVREERGLAYSIFSDLSAYRDTGCLTISAGTSRSRVAEVVNLILRELGTLKQEAVGKEELSRAKDNLKGGLMMSLESTSSRMAALARQEIYFGRYFTPDEVLAHVQSVTPEQVQQAARDFFQPQLVAGTLLGNLQGLSMGSEDLAC